MAKKRTKIAALAAAPMTVTIGGETIEVSPLPYGPALAWLEEFAGFQEKAQAVGERARGLSAESAGAVETIREALALKRAKAELIFKFAKIGKARADKLLELATGAEIDKALELCTFLAFQ